MDKTNRLYGNRVPSWKTIVIGALAAFVPVSIAYHVKDGMTYNRFPKTEQVQQGFIAPSRLKIGCEDSDRNGELETIVKVDNRSYELREVDGKPVILPIEVVPK